MDKRLLTLKESAQYLGRSVYSMRTLVWAGKVPVVQDGRKYWCDRADLDRYVDANKRMVA